MPKMTLFYRFFGFHAALAITIITFFSIRFDLNPLVVPVHIVFVLYYLAILFVVLYFVNRFFKARKLTILLLFLFQNAYFIFYIAYYFGKEKVGFPFTWQVIYPYLQELRNPFSFEYLSPSKLFYLAILLLILFFVQIRLFRNIYKEFHQLRFLSSNKLKYLYSFVLVLLLFPLLSLGLRSKRITSIKNNEPTLSFFSATINLEGRLSGIENIQIKGDYPSNLNFDKKNVILIICDAFRADHIGAYGSEEKLTPFLDSLAKSDSFLKVDHYFSTTSWSYNGILNTLTSSHKLYNNNFFLYDALKKQGYDVRLFLTGDFTNFVGLGKQLSTEGVDEYFDGYLARKKNPDIRMNDDRSVVLQKLKDFPKPTKTPSFLYLHFMSAHEIGIRKDHSDEQVDLLSLSRDEEKLKKDYKKRVRQLDGYLKEAFQILKDKKYLENSVVIITSDHGQSLGERKKYFHSQSTYYQEIHIPLLISTPKERDLLKPVALSDQLDVAPTVLDLLGLPIPDNWEGQALFSKQRKNKPIFQHQRDYYSIIWEESSSIYQYIYHQKTQKVEVFDITDSGSWDANIISQFSTQKLDSVQNLLFKYYDLTLK